MTRAHRRNAILIAVVAALAALLFLWELPRDARLKSRHAAAARLFPLDAAAVDTLHLRRDKETTTAVRRPDGWWLIAPVQERAEDQTVEGLVRALTQAQAEEVVIAVADTAVWPNFTLAPFMPGAVQIQLATGHGKRATVWAGGDNPDESGVYLRREGSRAIELSLPAFANLARLTYQALRRYQLFDVKPDSVEWLEVTGSSGHWSARRTPRGLWRTEEAEPRLVKRYEIELLLHDLAAQRIQAYVEDDVHEERWAAYGLHQPWLDLGFRPRGDEGAPHRLRVGNETEQHAWFARRDTLHAALRLSGPLLDTAARPFAQLLDTNPIPDNYALVDSVALRWLEGGSCTLVRDGREFKLRPPPGWQGDTTRVETPVRNVIRGLEELASDGTALLAGANGPETLAPEQRVSCRLYWPDRMVRFTLGWRSGENNHWLYVDGERVAHRVSRDLYFRLYSMLLAAGQIPGQEPGTPVPPDPGG